MVYTAISVSKNSKGHAKNHLVGSIDSVPTGTYDENGDEIFVDYVRAGADCLLGEVEGEPGSLAPCGEGQAGGEICGMRAIDPSAG